MTRTRLHEWKDDLLEHKSKILLAVFFLLLSLAATEVASSYVDGMSSATVPDLILDFLPVVDLSFIFIWGAVLVFVVYILYPLFYEPRRFHYAIGMLSLFILIRSAFLILTHLKAPVGAITVTAPGFLQILSYSNDLFFSGHTGLPFLGFLVYSHKGIKAFMLTASIILAITVLCMHVHYSIDVASAYFITYGIFVIGNPLFSDTTKVKA